MDKNKDSSSDYILKYIIIGDASVGKSNILLRYVYSTFKEEYQLTIGVEFGEKTLEINNKNFKIQIWDTAGQEQFRSITRSYYKNSVCAIVVYDITRRETFENVVNWIEDCKNNSSRSILIVLVGNKSDLESDRQIMTEEGKEFANKYGVKFFETSAKNKININEIFKESSEFIANRIEKNYYDLDNDACGIKRNYSINKLKNNNKKKSVSKKGCC